MAGSFLDRRAGELLDLFAAGKNVPGAGSAAALLGALAGSLLQAVAKYTLKSAASPGDRERTKLLLADAEERCGRLRKALDEDAAAFQRYWQSRREEDLWRAIHVPIAIAKDCLDLASMGIELYETGFRNARGEANAAALSAIAGAEAALHAARLNLKMSQDSGEVALTTETVRSLSRQLREHRERIAEATS
jgi:glutamate formiminotransferase/formiminotetrahydrofolate cyclodeaminase